jgi:hypothetical protein
MGAGPTFDGCPVGAIVVEDDPLRAAGDQGPVGQANEAPEVVVDTGLDLLPAGAVEAADAAMVTHGKEVLGPVAPEPEQRAIAPPVRELACGFVDHPALHQSPAVAVVDGDHAHPADRDREVAAEAQDSMQGKFGARVLTVPGHAVVA